MNTATLLLVAALGAAGVFTAFYALAFPPLRIRRAQLGTLEDGLQVRLQRAQLPTTPGQFVLSGVGLGVAAGAAAYFVTGSWLAIIPLLVGSFPAYWLYLGDRRQQRVNQYHHDLAIAMGIITNTWHTTPSLSRALEAVIKHGPGGGEGELLGIGDERGPKPGSVAADFAAVQRGLQAGRTLRDVLQEVADQRQSSIFDTLCTALLVADEAGAQAGAMLERQATITRQQVQAFDEALSLQAGARQDVTMAALVPWGLLLGVKVLSGGGALSFSPSGFFASLAGNLAALAASTITVGIYVFGMQLAGRGLLPGRVPTEYGKEVA